MEFYDPEVNQWTMVSSMGAHEGVVGVGVLPIDIDLQQSSNSSSKDQIITMSVKSQFINGQISSFSIANNNKPLMKSYYSLMEEEEEENQYQSVISQNLNN